MKIYTTKTGEQIELQDNETFCEKHYWVATPDNPCDGCDFFDSGLIFEPPQEPPPKDD